MRVASLLVVRTCRLGKSSRQLPVAMASDVFGKHTICVWCQFPWAPEPDSPQPFTLFLERIMAARILVNKAPHRLDV